VWEWVSDWYDSGYYSSLMNFTNPSGPAKGTYRVVRGGSYQWYNLYLRTAHRGYFDYPNIRFNFIGFRCAAPPAP